MPVLDATELDAHLMQRVTQWSIPQCERTRPAPLRAARLRRPRARRCPRAVAGAARCGPWDPMAPHCSGLVGPSALSTGAPTAAARWPGPVSLDTSSAAAPQRAPVGASSMPSSVVDVRVDVRARLDLFRPAPGTPPPAACQTGQQLARELQRTAATLFELFEDAAANGQITTNPVQDLARCSRRAQRPGQTDQLPARSSRGGIRLHDAATTRPLPVGLQHVTPPVDWPAPRQQQAACLLRITAARKPARRDSSALENEVGSTIDSTRPPNRVGGARRMRSLSQLLHAARAQRRGRRVQPSPASSARPIACRQVAVGCPVRASSRSAGTPAPRRRPTLPQAHQQWTGCHPPGLRGSLPTRVPGSSNTTLGDDLCNVVEDAPDLVSGAGDLAQQAAHCRGTSCRSASGRLRLCRS